MRKWSITRKLVFSSTGIFAALGLALGFYSITQLREMLYQETIRRVEAQALNWIEANISQIILSGSRAILDRLVNELQHREGIAYVILADAGGKLLAGAKVPDGLRELRPLRELPGARSRLNEWIDGRGRNYFELATPIAASGTGMSADLGTVFGLAARDQAWGTVRVGVDRQEFERRLSLLVRRNVALYAALVLLALGVSIWLARRLVTPITIMGRVANQIAAGDLSGRVQDGATLQDEVGELVRNFNQMAARLAENREEMNLLYAGLEEKVRERTLELEQANQRLQELDKLKSHFLSTVSHELRSPLTAIKAFAEILIDSPNPDPATRLRFLAIIDKESDRLSRLISDLLDLAKIESGAVGWRISDTDLSQVVTAATASLTALAGEKGMQFELSHPSPHPVRADADRMQQVANNLIGNAIKFCPPGSRITIRLERAASSGPKRNEPGRYVRVAVQDSGPGIRPEDRERVFEKFFQGARNRSAGPGTGLGLAICKEIVLYHGGEIWVESEPGQGSTFYFTTPLREERGASAASERRAESKGRA